MMLGSGSEEEVKALSAIEGLPFSGPVVLKGEFQVRSTKGG
jgi:hypothetical protein